MQARNVQIWLLLGSRMVQTLMRMAMGPLIVYICDEISCDASAKGTLLSAFSLGYVLTQIAGGALADKIGPKAVITLAMLGAALATIATPLSLQFGVTGLWATTVLMGACQGPIFPTSMAYLSKWLPPSERSYASTMLDSGITIGSLIALPVSGLLGSSIGWRNTFRCYGAITLVFVMFWHRLAESDPRKCTYISKLELAYLNKVIKSAPPSVGGSKQPPVCSGLMSHLSIWSIFVAHAAFNYGVYFQNSWTPIYYSEELKIRPEDAGIHFMAPHILNLLVKVVVTPQLMKYFTTTLKWPLITCRRWFTITGFVLSSGCLVLVSSAKTMSATPVVSSTGLLTLTMGACALHPSGFKANYMDVSLHNSGIVSGVGNTLASVASFVGPFVVAGILHHYNSWYLVFLSVAVANLLAAAFFGLCSTTIPVDGGLKGHGEAFSEHSEDPQMSPTAVVTAALFRTAPRVETEV
jgi:MFS family permease